MKTVNKEFYGCAAKVQLSKKQFKITIEHAGNNKNFNDAIQDCLYKFLMALQERKVEQIVS